MTPTKHKIIDTSIQLFNQYGIANVRLQQIADEVGISIGNLAYHFNNKEAIVASIFEIIDEKCAQILSLYSRYPNLLDFDVQLSKIFETFIDYSFCFLDILEVQRSYPEHHQIYKDFLTKLRLQIEKRIQFNQRRGVLMSEISTNVYQQIAQMMVLTVMNWLSLQITLQQNHLKEATFKEAIWLQLQPYFTEVGKAEFHKLIAPLLSK